MSDGESGQGNGVGLPRSALDGRGVVVGPDGALQGAAIFHGKEGWVISFT